MELKDYADKLKLFNPAKVGPSESTITLEIVDNIWSKATSKKSIMEIAPALKYSSNFWRNSQYGKKREQTNKFAINKSTGYFLTGLIPRIKSYCKRHDFRCVVVGNSERLEPIPIREDSLPGITLRRDQLLILEKALMKQRGFIESPTGSGKTVLISAILKSFPRVPAVVIVHTKDLLDQTIEVLQQYGLTDVGYIGDGVAQPDRITVGLIQSLYKIEQSEWHNSLKVVIVDECFAKGTKVKTELGEMNIELLCPWDKVFTPSGYKKVIRTFQNKVPLDRVIKLKLSNGATTFCSEDHLFKIRDGWVKAKQSQGKFLFTSSNFEDIIVSNTITNIQKGEENEERKIHTREKKVSLLQSYIYSKAQKSVLLLCSLFKKKLEPEKQIMDSGKNEEQQSDDQSYHTGEDAQYQKNKWNSSHIPCRKRWKWESIRASIKTCISPWMENGSAYKDKSISTKRSEKNTWLADMLQNRYSKQSIKDRHRSRWPQSLWLFQKGNRYQEREEVRGTWVEDIEIYQQGSNDESFKSIISDKERNQGCVIFYDLEVEDDHVYFANDVLVHNCHHLNESGTYEQFLQKTNATVRLGFSATIPFEDASRMFSIKGNLGLQIGEASEKALTEEGVLAKPDVHLLVAPHSQALLDITAYREAYIEGIVKNKRRNKMILDYAKRINGFGLTALIMVYQQEHGKNLLEMAKDNGFRNKGEIQFIYGYTEKEDRELAKKALEKGEVKVVICSTVWKEGVNIPSLGAVINAAGWKARIPTVQKVGRGLRTTETKDTIIVVDFLDVGNPKLALHSLHRIQAYVEKGWLGKNLLLEEVKYEKVNKSGESTGVGKGHLRGAEEGAQGEGRT